MNIQSKRTAPRAKKSRWLTVVVGVLMVLLMAMPQAEAAKKRIAKKAAKPVDRYGSIVIEADTGYVLSEKNADRQLHPASLTKLMTLYLTFEAIQNGRITKNTRIPVSKHAAFQQPSELGLAAGSTIRVEDAIYGVAVKSANDAAVVLGEALGGDEKSFADLMTRRARQLGMKNTTFKNASGLNNPQQYSSPRDMAILAQSILRDFPREYHYFSTKTFTYAGKTYANHNKLMNTYPGMDGFKTGYITSSGFNLVASAKRNGSRLIGVVFGGTTPKARNDHMAQLLDLGFERLNDVRVANVIAQRQQGGAIAKPLSATSAAAIRAAADDRQVATAQPQRQIPRFDAMGLVTDQGDAADPANDNAPAAATPAVTATTATTAVAARTAVARAGTPGNWAVQVGAFSTHDAGMSALKTAHRSLPANMTQHAEYIIVPLMTNRGVIYRARMTGLSEGEAAQACGQLKHSCIVLAGQ